MEREGTESDDSSDKEEKAENVEDEIKAAAQLFVITKGLWLRAEAKAFRGELDEEFYDPLNRFSDDDSKIQGQLREILDVLPDEYHGPRLKLRSVAKTVSSYAIC